MVESLGRFLELEDGVRVYPGHGPDTTIGRERAWLELVRASGLPNETNAMFTNVEGEWDEVMDVVRRATMAVAAVSPRVSLVLKADLREGATNALRSKVESVGRHLT